MLQFESTNSTITPAITLSGGAPAPLWQVTESTGIIFYYTTASFSHTKTAGTGNLTVRLVNTEAVKDFVTQINFGSDGIISPFSDLRIEKFVGLTHLYLFNNDLTGDVSTVVWHVGLVVISLGTNNFTGDLSSTVWPLGLTTLGLNNNNFTGDLSATIWPTNLASFYVHFNSFTGFPVPPIGSSPLREYQAQSNGANQAAVDAAALALYNNRANFTYATPTANIGGTNAAPSGIYQDATPPTTGKEYIYKLVNDPDAEGFNKWTITYTA